MPITKFLIVALASGMSAWLGWSVGRPAGLLSGFLVANLGFAFGWYFGRGFVRNNFD